MKNTTCPVCKGWETTSGNPNHIQHIKNVAKSELLKKHLLGKGTTAHADWLKGKVKVDVVKVYTITMGKDKATIQF